MSHSENKPKTSQTSSTVVTNLNVQDTEGVTVVGDGNTVTDHGAVAAALDVGIEALRLGGDGLDSSLSFAGRSVDAIVDVNRGAFDFGRDALDANSDISRTAIAEIADFGGRALGEVSTFGRDALGEVSDFGRDSMESVLRAGEGVLDFARDIFADSLDAQKGLTESNLTGLTTLAKQTSESADDRVTRTAGYAFAAIAVVMIAIAWKKAA